MQEIDRIRDALKHVSPGRADAYESWIVCGMIMKRAGLDLSEWDQWSRSSPKYREGACARRWESFSGTTYNSATPATIFAWAKQDTAGYRPPRSDQPMTKDAALSLDSPAPIAKKPVILAAPRPAPGAPVQPAEPLPSVDIPSMDFAWDTDDIVKYLSALYQPDDIVSYVFDSAADTDGKIRPAGRGVYDRQAGNLINALKSHDGDIKAALGEYSQAAGGWIRPNPVDGKGVGNANVVDCRYALVECDNLPLEQQYAAILKFKIPCAAIVHSGGKSIHAIVRIDAGANHELYAQRVAYLFDYLEKQGFNVDKACRNPARLSRLPGLRRGSAAQYLIGTNVGLPSWTDWEATTKPRDPSIIELCYASDFIRQEPEAADQILVDTFDAGDKLCLIAPPKMRKSFFFLQLCLSVSVGEPFLAWPVQRPRKVLLVQFEVKKHHYHRRVKTMATSMGITAEQLGKQLIIINARGKDLETLFALVIETAIREKIEVVAWDPMYKMHQGDENSAMDMKPLLCRFDSMAEITGAAMFYVHHDAKGVSSDRNIRDRGAGSNIVARDVDCSFTMHESPKNPDDIIIEVMLRSYAPQQAIVIKWEKGRFIWTGAKETEIPDTSKPRKVDPQAGCYLDPAMEQVADKVFQAVELIDKLKSALSISKDKARAVKAALIDAGRLVEYCSGGFPKRVYLGSPEAIQKYKTEKENPPLLAK